MSEPVQRKIVSPAALTQIAQNLRTAGRTIVHCHGCFDIVHPGHIRYLQYARQLGDVLVVSLTGDAGVAKGPDRPYISEELRAENVAALEFVDWVVIDPHPTACDLLAQLRPDVYVKGREYAQAADPRFQQEREVVERYGGRIAFHSGDVVFSSTRLLETLRADEQLDEQRLQTLCRRQCIHAGAVRQAAAAFAGAQVVVVGDVIRERYVFCDAAAVADEAPVLAAQQLGVAEYWGGAAAVALQSAALGAQTSLIGVAGQDDESGRAAEHLSAHGVACDLLPLRPALVERTTFIADDAKLLKITTGPSVPLDSAAEKRSAAALADHLRRADVLLWCDQGLGAITPGLLAAVGKAARQRRLFVAGYAAGSRGQLLALTRTHLLTATERQVRDALHDMSSGLPAVVSNLLHVTRGQTAIVSLRKRGLIAFDARGTDAATAPGWRQRLRSEFVPALTRHYADLLGAEEAVLAAAALTLAGGGALVQATYLAAAVESLAVGYSGGNPPNVAALLALLDRRPELQPETRFVTQRPARLPPAEMTPCTLPD